MPWIDQEKCTGCSICVDKCPVGAVALNNSKADIDEENCIRCGVCHDVCPQEAVRHDSERIPLEIEANMEWTRRLLKHFDTPEEQRGLIERMKRYFTKERKIAEQSIVLLDQMAKESQE